MKERRTIGVIEPIPRHSDDMRMDIRRVDHLRDDVLDRLGADEAHIHLKLVLERHPSCQSHWESWSF